MITIDEEMVGSDDGVIIIHGLRLCVGLICRLNNGELVGAHFSPGCSLQGMNAVMGCIAHTPGGPINWMFMASKFDLWGPVASNHSGHDTKEKLAAYFKANLQFTAQIEYLDMQHDVADVPPSYDIRSDAGINPTVKWRPTPSPDPTVQTPSNRVWKLTHNTTTLIPEGGPGLVRHCQTGVPSAGFILLHDAIKRI